ncbi:TorF family putative porin [Maricaulis salignorans]|uniref:TorF family putative porin n=1 Tax=Maricaulis salignorans TaxID=144026 RepID=UPI003A954583
MKTANAKFAGLALAALLGTAAATTASAQTVEGNVALTSDYIFRGVTQTDGGPAISGGFDVADDSGLYAGIWGSSVDFGDDTTMELDLYGGYATTLGSWDIDVGGIFYGYPDSPSAGGDQNFWEFYAGVGHALGPVAWDAKLSWSPDFYLESGPAAYIETGLAYEFAAGVALDARIGASRFDDIPAADYEDYQIGISGTAFDTVSWDARYHALSDDGDDSFVFTISQSFGG